MEFSEYLGLKDRRRDSLEPDPERDTDLYVDLDGLVPRSMAQLAARAPKLVLMGDYGTGKTHLIHVLQALTDKNRFESVYLKLEPFGRWAESRHLHDALLSALETNGRFEKSIPADSEAMPKDLRVAFGLLRENPGNPDARAWLLARGPTPAKARKLGFSAPLAQTARGVTYAAIWRFMADAFRVNTGREILFLIDESETFQEQVDQTRAADMGVAIREMFDKGNQSFGVVMGLTAPKGRVGEFSSHPLGRPDVASRVQDIVIHLGRLDSPERRRKFIFELLGRLLQRPGTFLSAEAVDALVVNGPAWVKSLSLIARDPVQRDYVKLLNSIAKNAFRSRLELPLVASSIPSHEGRL
ncbi:MAG: hypothetical protein Q8M65_01795 [Rhodoglobus sp.]|nr:hypothetical protein [Rhodoglobus sp.]